MSRGELRAVIGEGRLGWLKSQAAALEISEAELLRRIIDGFMTAGDGWAAPDSHPTLDLQRGGRSVPGFVYVMQHLGDDELPGLSLYKIGFSTNPLRRLSEVSKAEDAAVDLVCSIPSSDMRVLERELHQRFANYRERGEWFRLTIAQVAYLTSLAAEES